MVFVKRGEISLSLSSKIVKNLLWETSTGSKQYRRKTLGGKMNWPIVKR